MANDADPGGTDLGRRIVELRGQAGLSVAETAERAGMSPGYLAYLESSPEPNPTHATLTRLAAALGADPSSLFGAGLNLPPGQRAAAKNTVLDVLTIDECRAYIAAGGVGRFVYVEPGRGPVAVPVNYRMDADDVVFRTDIHTAIVDSLERDQRQKVSFDVDHLDDALSEGWSVLLTGTARIITDQVGLERAAALGIEPWAGGDRTDYIRVAASQITGRRIRVTG